MTASKALARGSRGGVEPRGKTPTSGQNGPNGEPVVLGEFSDFGSSYLSFFRALIIAPFTAVCLVVQITLSALRLPGYRRFPHWYHRRLCRLLGFRVKVKGRRVASHPTLFVANHVSYWDITLLGSVLDGGCFVAKAEIANWPVIGWMAKLQRSVFVDRRASQVKNHHDSVLSRLEDGDDLILFPEGTSYDGTFVLPFKSSLFAVAEEKPKGEPLTVQPISIAYTRLDGQPMGRFLRGFYAWYGDMELVPHLWHCLSLGHLTVEIVFHEPVNLSTFADRKDLASHCHHVITRGLGESLTGHRMGELRAEASHP